MYAEIFLSEMTLCLGLAFKIPIKKKSMHIWQGMRRMGMTEEMCGDCSSWVVGTWEFTIPFFLIWCVFENFHDWKVKRKKNEVCQCLSHSFPSWLLLHNINWDLNVGNLIMGVFAVWLQQREKFDRLFLESEAVRVSKKSDVEMNNEDSLLSDVACRALRTFWELCEGDSVTPATQRLLVQ